MRKGFSLLGIFLITGCASLEPVVQNFNLISVEEERRIGEEVKKEIVKEMVIVQDPAMNQRVRSVGEKLVKALPRRDFDYQFYVVQDDAPNAFTIPAGAIYVHTGLLRFVDNDELAGVLGHEIGHAYARHPAKSLSRAYGVDYLTRLLFRDPQGKFKTISLQLAKGSILLKYGREDEREADELAFSFLRQAGFPTSGLLRFLRKLQTMQRGGVSIPFLSTHPPTPERISRLEALEQGSIRTPQG